MIQVLAVLFLIHGAEAVTLRELSIDYDRFHPSARMPEIPAHRPKEGLAFNFDVNLGGPFFWDNRVWSLTDDGQYRFVSWSFQLGVRVLPELSLSYHHQSGHLLDAHHPWMKFPVKDSISLHWAIYQAPVTHPTIF